MEGITNKELDKTIEIIDRIRTDAQKDREYAFSEPWEKYFRIMRLLTPQSSGNRIQNYIFKLLGWEKVKAQLNKGDVKNSLDQYFEVKTTIITPSNRCANIIQIRLWQDISGYYIFVIDATKKYDLTCFFLSKAEMTEEVELYGTSAHGTKDAIKSNKKVEWALRVKWDVNNETYQRWIKKYKQNIKIKEAKEKQRKAIKKPSILLGLYDQIRLF